MKSWLILLGGPIVWAVHFFGLYGLAEFVSYDGVVLALVLALTVLCVAADLALLRRAVRLPADDSFAGWRRSVAAGGVALSLLAVIWQALPAAIR
jgi:hypothetical protein